MVRVGLSEVDDNTAKKYPGLENYTACQSKAFVFGMCVTAVGAGAGYSGYLYLKNKLPIPAKFNIVFSAVSAVVFGYIATSVSSRQCQETWLKTAESQGKIKSSQLNFLQRQNSSPDTSKQIPDEPSSVEKNKYGDYFGKPVR